MKLGIAGSGGIVKEVLLALQEVEEVQVTAIFVRPHSLERGKPWQNSTISPPSIPTTPNFFKTRK